MLFKRVMATIIDLMIAFIQTLIFYYQLKFDFGIGFGIIYFIDILLIVFFTRNSNSIGTLFSKVRIEKDSRKIFTIIKFIINHFATSLLLISAFHFHHLIVIAIILLIPVQFSNIYLPGRDLVFRLRWVKMDRSLNNSKNTII